MNAPTEIRDEALVRHPFFTGLVRPATVPLPGRVTLTACYFIFAFGVILFWIYMPATILAVLLYLFVAFIEDGEPYKIQYLAIFLLMRLMSLRSWTLWRGNSCSPFA